MPLTVSPIRAVVHLTQERSRDSWDFCGFMTSVLLGSSTRMFFSISYFPIISFCITIKVVHFLFNNMCGRLHNLRISKKMKGQYQSSIGA